MNQFRIIAFSHRTVYHCIDAMFCSGNAYLHGKQCTGAEEIPA